MNLLTRLDLYFYTNMLVVRALLVKNSFSKDSLNVLMEHIQPLFVWVWLVFHPCLFQCKTFVWGKPIRQSLFLWQIFCVLNFIRRDGEVGLWSTRVKKYLRRNLSNRSGTDSDLDCWEAYLSKPKLGLYLSIRNQPELLELNYFNIGIIIINIILTDRLILQVISILFLYTY